MKISHRSWAYRMKRGVARYLPALMLVAIMGDDLHVAWGPHPDNIQLRVGYNCEKDASHPSFLAVNVFDIEPGQGTARVRRLPTPVGQQCLIALYIMRTPPNWDGAESNMVVAEWQVMSHKEQ